MVLVTGPVILQKEGERFPDAPVAPCSSSVHGRREAEQTGLMLANISFAFSLTHSLHIQRQMFQGTREGGWLKGLGRQRCSRRSR